MKFAILSDSHDHIPHLKKALAQARKAGAEVLFHCGDLISPFMVPVLAEFPGPVHFIQGNNRGDPHLLEKQVARFPQVHFHGEFAFLEVGGLSIAMVHYPDLARGLAATGDYHLVLCGHTHVYKVLRIKEALVINPGEILGKEGPPTFALYDTETREVEKVILAD
ncbi:metallophosphoesterase [Thermosulfurimonas marina]|uniref:Phosphoesterase n=1 Tax=Thermosulfurimonas marina TaxID=2047767 RepID=A0A6H1WSU1_9BACT|nr:metallophosphoesterase [Thermosulfurimonas marina]QJA06240.1 metallophosphoesterase [Thermosulfurimonas marina]